MRADLLALSDDDLAALSNRGTVKRARAEVDAGTPTMTLEESPEGVIVAQWSDDARCTIPAGLSIARGQCTCPAAAPCRHLVRTAIAYRAHAAAARAPSESAASAPTRAAIPASIVERATKRFGEGQLFELTRGAKPIARCHSLGVVTRFFIADDPNQAVCDCGEPAPCEHAVMAVWAFERLAPDVHSGLVDTRSAPYPVPAKSLDGLEAVLREWTSVGVSDAPGPLVDRVRNAEAACRKDGLVWIAEGLDELATLKAAYDARDARFDAGQLCRVLGELVVRSDATRSNRGIVPPLFVRGSAVDRPITIASARLVGLGCSVRVRRSSYELTAFMQAEDTGQVVAVVRELTHKAGDTKPLSDAARASVSKGIALANVASGRTLLKGGKRSPGGVLSFGRAPASTQPQAFAWEKLRAPVLADGWEEVAAHLAELPPKPLRPRRLAEDVYVVPVASVEGAGFDRVEQSVRATLRDAQGAAAHLEHPFHARAAAGSDALLAALAKERVVFVAGRARMTGANLVIEPFSVVIERDGVRKMIQPWIESAPPSTQGAGFAEGDAPLDPQRFVVEDLANALGEFFVRGAEGHTPANSRQWREHASQAGALGFGALVAQLAAFGEHPDAGRALALAAMVAMADG